MLNKKKYHKIYLTTVIILIIVLGGILPNVSGSFFNNNMQHIISKKDFDTGIQSYGIIEHNIIITSSLLYNVARELEDFHDNNGISTKVINTTWIDENINEAPSPKYAGYSNRLIPRLLVKNYDFSLSKKIINFLRDEDLHPALEYVTILGDAAIVPPSYYIHSRGRMSSRILRYIKIPDLYNNIVPTDFFYTSPDYNLNPDFKVGRISVSNSDEASTVINKIKNWRENKNFEWFKNINVAGDQPNLLEEINLRGSYAGELIAVDAINQNYFYSMNINKLFWTENKFNKNEILTELENGNAGFMYMMAHGYVDRWGTYKEQDPFIYANDILEFPENINIPVIVSVACMAGAFDTDLICASGLEKGTKSLGEAFLLSQGAGIAYVGTSRATLGSPLLHLDNGQVVITKERGIAGMLTYFFEAYKNGETYLGDLTLSAIQRYINENNFPSKPEKENDFIVLASFVLLGDPALDIPPYTLNNFDSPYKQPEITVINPEGNTSEEFSRPWYYIDKEIELNIESDSPYVYLKLIDIDTDTVVEREKYFPRNGSFSYKFTSHEPTEYLIRAESADGKESWLYLTTIEKDSC